MAVLPYTYTFHFKWLGRPITRQPVDVIAMQGIIWRKDLVRLDSNHTHEHVRAELAAYAPLVPPGSSCVVFDTIIEDLPADASPSRPWGRGSNPKTAVREYPSSHPKYVVDTAAEDKLALSVAP